jgi:transcriptional regulator with XRE-family HTH domain
MDRYCLPRMDEGARGDGAWLLLQPHQLAAFREEHGLTLAAVAAAVGVSATSVQQWERGSPPSPRNQRALARLLEAGPGALRTSLNEGVRRTPEQTIELARLVRGDPERLRAWRSRNGLTVAAVAQKLGTTPGLVSRWESGATWPQRPMRDRLAALLETLDQPASEPVVEQPPLEVKLPGPARRRHPKPPRPFLAGLPLDLDVLAALVAEVRAERGTVDPTAPPVPAPDGSASRCVEDDLDALLLARPWRKERGRSALARHWGWDGRGGCTYTEAGREVELTHERVRQIARATVAALVRPTALPHLERALDLVRARTPCVAEEVDAALVSDGLCRGPFRVEGLLAAALVLGRALPARVHGAERRVLVPPSADLSWLGTAEKHLHADDHRWGCASVSRLMARLRDRHADLDERFLRLMLPSVAATEPLDAAGEWLALRDPAPDGVLRGRVRKALTMLGAVDVGDLHAALARRGHRRSLEVPFGPDVLLEVARRMPGVEVDGVRLSAGPGFVPYELDKVDRALVEALDQTGSARQAEVAQVMRARRLPKGTEQWSLHQHPFVIRTADGYALLGRAKPADWSLVTPEQIRSYQEQHSLDMATLATHLGVPAAALERWLDGLVPMHSTQRRIQRALARPPASGPADRPPARPARNAPVWRLVTPDEIEAQRKRRGFSKKTLARHLGVSAATLEAWTSGEEIPTRAQQKRIRAVLDTPASAPRFRRPSTSKDVSEALARILAQIESGVASGRLSIDAAEIPKIMREIHRAL